MRRFLTSSLSLGADKGTQLLRCPASSPKAVLKAVAKANFDAVKMPGQGRSRLAAGEIPGISSISPAAHRRFNSMHGRKLSDGRREQQWNWSGDRSIAVVLGAGGCLLSLHGIKEMMEERDIENWEVLEATLVYCHVNSPIRLRRRCPVLTLRRLPAG